MSLAFKQARADDECVEMYETAFNAQPTNDSMAVELFVTYARVGNFKKMQQVHIISYISSEPKYSPFIIYAATIAVPEVIQIEE